MEPATHPQPTSQAELHPPRKYLALMFALLMSATIFEGYDITIFHLCTPLIASTFKMSDSAVGFVATLVRFGGLLSFGMVASADLYGRRPILSVTVIFYTVFTLATALSRGMVSFTIFQSAAQLFLAAEFGVAITMVSEEFPDESRGRAIAALHTVAFLGVAAAAAIFPFMVSSRWGWRGMYLLGIAPLILTAFLRRGLRETVAISAACGLATAPISWLQFQQIPLVTVPANAVAAFAVAPMLALALVCALVAPVAPPLATGIAWANGWLAAYLAACARLFGGLPGAQIRSPAAAAGLALCLLGAGAYAWRRGRSRAEAGLPPHRRRHAEDRARAAPAAGADR